VLHDLAQSVSPFFERIRRAAQPFHRIVGIARIRVPCHIRPYLLEENIDVAPLGPVEDTTERLHLGAVPVEDAFSGLV
jgi:hypothetical protein